MPPTPTSTAPAPTPASSGPAPDPKPAPLADLLNSNRSLTTFSNLTRLQSSTSSVLASESDATTVLAPLNSALDSLPRKPWEDAADYESLGSNAYEGDQGRQRADRNLARFVDAHLVPRSPWPQNTRVRSRAGRELWWELGSDGSSRLIMPDRVQVDRVAARASNGEIWLLKGVLSLS
ncbi:hypothetical protein CP532_0821 [Ophiocordyceps camponoti-leonardi (nom. inval.)]|nr:hypothetical protein CP532_0821 [Ophiocordyceps camponoti-leonardi (nom. inval.)]